MQNWLVLRTRPRWEKKAAQRLIDKGVETFFPLVKQRRQWSDRVKLIDLPLLPTFLFVRISKEQVTTVRLTEGVVNFVYSNGKPVTVKEKLIQHIRHFQQVHPQGLAVMTNGQASEKLVNGGINKQDTLWIETLNVLLVAPLLASPVNEASKDKI